MGTADREYTRHGDGESGGFFAQLTPVVKWLLIANVGIYLIDMLFLGQSLRNFGAFAVRSALMEGRVWEFVTFQFLHGSIGHVLFNSMALFFFGPWMERWWGANRFLAFYLLCGIAGAAFFTLLVFAGFLPRENLEGSLVGASAGIYGILIGVGLIAPDLRVRLLFPPVELSMRQLAIGLVALSAGMILLRLGGNEGGEAGHLGGAILGFFLVRNPALLNWARKREPGVRIVRPKAFNRRSEAKIRPRTKIQLDRESAVDRILDKISREGFQSLTQAERDLLTEASKSHQADR